MSVHVAFTTPWQPMPFTAEPPFFPSTLSFVRLGCLHHVAEHQPNRA
jgi:hypothetical protein